jgi:protein Mpv17
MTRGWSIAEKAMRIPLDNWSSYESSLNQQPIFTKTMINVVIYLLGDWLSQTLFIQKNLLEFDARRTLRNGFIGMCFGPLVHEYYEFSDSILPVEIGMNRFYKIFMDQTIYLSIKCSVYIVAVNVLAGESWEYSYESAKDKIKGIMFTAWKFWPLVHCVTYGAIPARHRILWVNCVDLFWNAILASMTSGSDDDEEDVENAEDGENSVENGNGIDAATAAATSINLVMETAMQTNGDDIDIAKVNESKPKLEKEDITELTEVLLESMKEGNNMNGNGIGNGVENNNLNTNGSNGLGNSKDASLEKEEKKDSDSQTVIIDDYSSEVTAATTAAAINGTSTSISGVL